jgi:hypothetical protein
MPVLRFIGRETREGPGVKRKRTNNVHMFRIRFARNSTESTWNQCTTEIGSRTRRSVLNSVGSVGQLIKIAMLRVKNALPFLEC